MKVMKNADDDDKDVDPDDESDVMTTTTTTMSTLLMMMMTIQANVFCSGINYRQHLKYQLKTHSWNCKLSSCLIISFKMEGKHRDVLQWQIFGIISWDKKKSNHFDFQDTKLACYKIWKELNKLMTISIWAWHNDFSVTNVFCSGLAPPTTIFCCIG